jgi:hypothetical protein
MAGKRKSTAKRARARRPLTLDALSVTWTDAAGETRRADGPVLAWLLTRAEHLTGAATLHTLDVASGTGPSLLRGLGALLYPDAGEPVPTIAADRRYFLAWAADELAAQQHADRLVRADHATTFTVTVAP